MEKKMLLEIRDYITSITLTSCEIYIVCDYACLNVYVATN